jgi:hypothetical protein
MTNEKPYEPQENRTFIYRLEFNVVGVCESDAPEDYTKTLLEETLRETYPEGVTLIDFKLATPEEAEMFAAMYDAQAPGVAIN